MPKGISLHIGLNELDENQYGREFPTLKGCVNDAKDMQLIAQARGFETMRLLDSEATSEAIIGAIRRAAGRLTAGDFFLLTFSGHGSRIPDDPKGDDGDGEDETWVVYDRNLIDDEFAALWAQFRPGVRIFMVSDSCHSGTMHFIKPLGVVSERSDVFPQSRRIPPEVRGGHFTRFRIIYDEIRKQFPPIGSLNITASLILLAACQADQKTLDGRPNGVFTSALKRVWNNGLFRGNYREFRDRIEELLNGRQSPQLDFLPGAIPAFEAQHPFNI